MQHAKILAIAVALLLLAAGAGGYFWMLRQEPGKLVTAARAALDRGDYMEASLNARRALELQANNIPACQVMGDLCEQAEDPSALSWRKRVLDLSANSSQALIAGATTALHFGQRSVARAWMDQVPAPDRPRADYEALSGAFALDAGRYADAQHFFADALRLTPGNPQFRFSLARAESLSADYFSREAGRKLLQELATTPNYESLSLRALVVSYQSTDEPEAALIECRKLVASEHHTFQDELLLLHFLHEGNDPAFSSTLAQTQSAAADNPNNAGALLAWMSTEDLVAAAVSWATVTVPKVGQYPAVQPALGQCYLVLQDWDSLLKVTGQDPWDQVEYIRHAYRARALRESGNLMMAHNDWSIALDMARGNAGAVGWLAHVTTEWNWPDESEEALWGLIELSPDDQWGLQTLYRHYVSDGDTAGLRKLAAYLVKVQPSNKNAENDFAILSLLLNRDVKEADALAADLYRQFPGNPVFASTYAYALQCEGRPADALGVLEALPRDAFKDPALAAYYGIILAANHAPDRARPYLQSAQQGSLLPEERALVEKASEETGTDPN